MQFQVTAQDLYNFANYCDGQNQQIQGQVLQVVGFIQDLEGYNTGPAAAQLQADVVMWQNDARQLATVMSEITANLRHTAHNYVAGETVSYTNLAQVGGSLAPARL